MRWHPAAMWLTEWGGSGEAASIVRLQVIMTTSHLTRPIALSSPRCWAYFLRDSALRRPIQPRIRAWSPIAHRLVCLNL